MTLCQFSRNMSTLAPYDVINFRGLEKTKICERTIIKLSETANLFKWDLEPTLDF